MDYQALYRKYRPQRFAEIVGQTHVTETLLREVVEGKVAHAYLFAGPRGTGKTTAARVLAKSLNCQNRLDSGEPCNECPSCVSITEGSSMDVTELDAASHNSVDDIRDMRVNISTVASVGGAKRIYILDEAHMLSKAAGNALLKTLEEPPEHVHFVLATTEPYKLLDTIRSRSQRFDFHSIGIESLTDHLRRLSKAEGYVADPSALSAVARHARGSARDALSLLEQVAALGEGNVDTAGVNRALGLADREAYSRLASAVADLDATSALGLVARLVADGVDLRRFLSEAIAFFRGVFLVKYAPNVPEITDESGDVIAEWEELAKELSASDVLRVLDALTDTLLQIREGREERLMVELTLLKLTRPEVASDPASLTARIETLEKRMKRMASGITPADPHPAQQAKQELAAEVHEVAQAEPAPIGQPSDHEERMEQPFESEPTLVVEQPQEPQPVADSPPPEQGASADPVTLLDFESVWPALVASLRDLLGSRRHALFREASPGHVEGSVLVLYLPPHLAFHLEQLSSDPDVGRMVSAKASELLGSAMSVAFRRADAPAPVAEREEVPDKDDLDEAPAEAVDPTTLVTDLLGGEVVEEQED